MIRMVPVVIGLMLGAIFIAGCEKREMHVKTVKVNSSAVYCLFDPSCAVNSTDSSRTPIPMQAGGTALLHSRTFAGKPGTPASGLYGYEYRLDLEKASETMVDIEGVATRRRPCVLTLSLEFGPIVETLDYDGDGKAGDAIYVVTSGGPGTIKPGAVHRWRNKLIVGFDSPICVGPSGGHGDSSYFFWPCLHAAIDVRHSNRQGDGRLIRDAGQIRATATDGKTRAPAKLQRAGPRPQDQPGAGAEGLRRS